eukprot:scaffold2616_cov106-Isochrysis_galbana.AAC.5
MDSQASADPSSAFTLYELLGEGTFGLVHRAMDVRSGQQVAIKQLPLCDAEKSSSLQEEVELLSSVRHECIVAYHGAFRTSSQLWIVTEFAGDSIADVRPPCTLHFVAGCADATHTVRPNHTNALGRHFSS